MTANLACTTEVEGLLETGNWSFIVFLGCVYPIANFLGYYETGVPLYPIVDWSSYPLTLLLFGVLALFMGLMYLGKAKIY